jgi:D-glycero-D-manno-heptose 1,7-bisphosphate phosphatase
VTELYILDKDGTLTDPIWGGVFVQHPEDQRLRPGVAEKLDRLRSEGAVMAIASNQGGCAPFMTAAKNAQVGQYITAANGRPGLVLHRSLVMVPERPPLSKAFFSLGLGGHCNHSLILHPDDQVELAYKTIESAIEEMRFAMGLSGISTAAFCPAPPSSPGENAIVVNADPSLYNPRFDLQSLDDIGYPTTGYRKPNPGMLQLLGDLAKPSLETRWTRKVMVGDRPEDKAAAEAAGFEFEWADDFFGPCKSTN